MQGKGVLQRVAHIIVASHQHNGRFAFFKPPSTSARGAESWKFCNCITWQAQATKQHNSTPHTKTTQPHNLCPAPNMTLLHQQHTPAQHQP
jgi:hypothetical protein